jgi:hypothetical protein
LTLKNKSASTNGELTRTTMRIFQELLLDNPVMGIKIIGIIKKTTTGSLSFRSIYAT